MLKRGLSPGNENTAMEKKLKRDSDTSDDEKSASESEPVTTKKQQLEISNEDCGLPSDTPAWGVALLAAIRVEFVKFNKRQDDHETTVTSSITKSTKTINKLMEKVHNLEIENQFLHDYSYEMKEKLLDLEFRQRCNNLVFDGFHESESETGYDCYLKIKNAIRNIPGIDPNFKVDRCHRLGPKIAGRRRAIIACINWYGDVVKILNNRKMLQKGIFVSEDYPSEWIDRRRVLLPLFKKLKSMSEFTGKVHLTRDKLIVNNVIYRSGPTSNLASLNEILDMSATCEKRDDTNIVFHGIHSVFSNFHPAPFREWSAISYC